MRVAVIGTGWEQFRALDFERIKKIMAGAVVVDLRNIYPPDEIRALGFAYHCIGRSNAWQRRWRSARGSLPRANPQIGGPGARR